MRSVAERRHKGTNDGEKRQRRGADSPEERRSKSLSSLDLRFSPCTTCVWSASCTPDG